MMGWRTLFSITSPAGARGRLSILIFHRVLPIVDPLFPDEPDVRRFDETMGWIRSWFNVLPLNEAVARLKTGQLPARAAAITFDDGYADNLVHAVPILDKHGLSATVFVAPGFLDGGRMWNDTVIESIRNAKQEAFDARPLGLGRLVLRTTENKRVATEILLARIKFLTADERGDAVDFVKESCRAPLPDDLMLTTEQLLAWRRAGMGVGAHTMTHPILANMSDDAVRQEISDSRDFLEGMLGERIEIFAYPNGKLGRDYTRSHAAIVEDLGFTAAVTTNWGACCHNRSDMYQLPRFSPWDRSSGYYALRLLKNYWQQDSALLT